MALEKCHFFKISASFLPTFDALPIRYGFGMISEEVKNKKTVKY